MKIAFISFYSGSVNRGVESLVHELASRLAINHKVTVFQEGRQFPKTKYTIIRIPMSMNWDKRDMTATLMRRFFIDYWSIKVGLHVMKIFPIIWKEKYDIVIPLNGGWQPAILRILTWLHGGKLVVSGQSGMGWDDRNNLWSFPDSFVGLTSKAKTWAKKVNPIVKNIVYIPNGVDLNKFKPKGKIYKTKLKKPIILCVGALTLQKRINLVINAVSKLNNASLLVAAGDKDKVNIGKLGRTLLGNRFELISVPYRKIPDVYRAADMFTLVSESTEAFGNVFIEAMAANLAVVAIDDEQRREIVGNAGTFIDDPTDIGAYANALKKTLNTNWGDKPRSQAKKFDWDKIAEKYEELFKELTK